MLRDNGRILAIIVFIVLVVAILTFITLYFRQIEHTTPVQQPITQQKVNITSEKDMRSLLIFDVLGRKVEVKIPVERIVLIDGGLAGYVATIDAVGGRKALEKIVAMDITGWKKRSPELYRLYVETYPELAHVRDLGAVYTGNINISVLISVQPDVVIASATLYDVLEQTGTISVLARHGIPIVFIDLRGGDLNKTLRSIEIVGKLLGEEDRARRIVDWIQTIYNLVKFRLRDIIYEPKTYIDASADLYSAWSSLVELSTGVPVRSIDEDTDVVIIAVENGKNVELGTFTSSVQAGTTLHRLLASLDIANTSAARHGRVCMIYAGLAQGVWNALALEYVAKLLHPAVFRDIEPTRDLKEFFQSFLSVPFKGTWFTCLNQTPRMVAIVDALGRKVVVPSPAKRIAVLYGLEDLVAVGGESALARVVALNVFRYRNWRPDWWIAWVEHFPWLNNIPDVGQPGYNFDLEKLVSVKPDVVIAAPWMFKAMQDSGALERLKDAHIPVVVIDFVPSSASLKEHLEAVRRSLNVLGVITGYVERAKSLYEFYLNQVMLVVNRTLSLSSTEKPGVIVFATWDPWRAYGAKSPYNVWITLAGGINLAAKAVPGSSGNIDPEYVLKTKPDIIIFACNNNFYTGHGTVQKLVIGYTVEDPEDARKALLELIERPGWDSLPAVREGRVYMLYHGLSHGHIFQFAALQWLAKWLHPDLFKDLDPLKNLELFYEMYMPYPLRGIWAVGLQ